MSESDRAVAGAEFESSEYQPSYVFSIAGSLDTLTPRPKKRRKISQNHETPEQGAVSSQIKFPSSLNGLESSACVAAREHLFEDSWASTEAKLQSILRDANETTLEEVTKFISSARSLENRSQIPTGLIVTGPNIASQELLFSQLAEGLRSQAEGPVVVIRSGDGINLKSIIKKIIRDATNEKDGYGETQAPHEDRRKVLNYDLKILYDHLKSSRDSKVIVAFQDSEAFESNLLAEVLALLSSWLDRIPFVVLFGIATSVELFRERLPRAATRCLYGAQFDVEQTSETLGKIFRKVVAGRHPPVHLGSGFVTMLLERQHDHVQSLQTFISALKYAYMCHFYANPLSVFLSGSTELDATIEMAQREHLEAIRTLPSFRQKIKLLLDQQKVDEARNLLESDAELLSEIGRSLRFKDSRILKLQQAIYILASVAPGCGVSIDRMELYVKAFSGELENSDLLRNFLGSIQVMAPSEVVSLIKCIIGKIDLGDPGSDLEGWADSAKELIEQLAYIRSKVQKLQDDAEKANMTIRSKYNAQSKILRTTVVAQRVQLSKEKSSLSKFDISYSDSLDELSNRLQDYFKFENPLKLFLHEIWLYDSKSPNREVFTPKPRYAIERALSVPHDYLGCACCGGSEGALSSSQPPTAIIYQLYLETGGLINVFDLWSAFFAIIGGEDGEDCDERNALALFYRALADLKLLGMIKQSRKKTDHLAKLAWKGL